MKQIENEIKMAIGRDYINGTFENEGTKDVADKYRTIAEVTKELFDIIPFEVIFTDEDPYPSSKVMRKEVIESGKIYIFTIGSDEHDYFTEQENNMFRAVHDVFAHMVCGCPFSFQGEYNAYLEQRKHYPEETWALLFAEIPAQTGAYYHAGSFDFPQRPIEAPQEWLDMCEKHLVKDYSHNSVISKDFVEKHRTVGVQ